VSKDYKHLWHELKKWIDGSNGVLSGMIKDNNDINKHNELISRKEEIKAVWNKIEELEKAL